jgi:hypothetical protein
MAIAWLLPGRTWPAAGLQPELGRRGVSVRPSKLQDMSNNIAATADGGEIGRGAGIAGAGLSAAERSEGLEEPVRPDAARAVRLGMRRLASGVARSRKNWRRCATKYIVSMDAPLVEQPTGDQSPARCRVGEGPCRR